MGPAGVLALPASLTRPQVEGLIAEARDFAAEWKELNAHVRKRLYGFCLRAPLAVIRLS